MEQLKRNNIGFLLDQFAFNESDELIYQIDHAVFDDELYMIVSNEGAFNLYFSQSQYLIPVFSDYRYITYTLNSLKNEEDFDVEIATGADILTSHFKDNHFFGLAINPPFYDYVLTCSNFKIVE
ncbi:MAG: hypothetical protein Q4P18_03030 [Methanobrevibacter sp.]|uniref:hypothetical protein n=1 Tax=Methanobrevibacter sp. TaxID=66852 RepID=UPI0026E051CF|nr:hypothetical protein [Methanobrevibacter sp.]MDO5848485.1 hypothetical protein [Methanobrevibacter sp.]